MTSLESENQVYQALLSNSWDEVNHLLRLSSHSSKENRTKFLQYKSERDENSLHIACMNPGIPTRTFKKLFHSCPKAILQQNDRGETPLHIAAGDASDRIIKFLLRHCPPRTASIVNHRNEPPLYIAISFCRSPTTIQKFLEAYPLAILHINSLCMTPFQYFAFEWESAVRYLLSNHHLVQTSRLLLKQKRLFLETLFCLLYHRRICACILQQSDILNQAENNASFSSSHRDIYTKASYPLHLAILDPECPWIFVHLILSTWAQEGIKMDPNGNFPIHLIITTLKTHVSNNKNKRPTLASYPSTSEQDQLSLLQNILKLHPETASIPTNQNGKLPLALYIESARKYNGSNYSHKKTQKLHNGNCSNNLHIKSKIMKELFFAQPKSLTTRDKMTHIYPFMLAGLNEQSKTSIDAQDSEQSKIKGEADNKIKQNERNPVYYSATNDKHKKKEKLTNQLNLGFELLMTDPSVVKHALFDIQRSESLGGA